MKTKILSILALLLTVTQGAWAQTLPTDESGAYTIGSKTDWETFCTDVNGGISYSGKIVKLTDNVSGITTRTSTNLEKPFSGTFDGQGNTLNLNINVTTDDATAAPFGYINGATIKNLHITGSETTAGMRIASIAGFAANSTITNCWSEVVLSSSRAKDIDGGAIVARTESGTTVTLNGCLFTGSITYSNATGYEGGGMVGWRKGTVVLNNCVFAPSAITITKYQSHNMFIGNGSGTLTNCYYNDVAAATSLTVQGKRGRSITAGDGVTIYGLGEATDTYDVSGINVYSNGVKGGDTYYAENGQTVTLNLNYSKTGYAFISYTTTGGTLANPTTNSPTLTMPDDNVTIGAENRICAGTEEDPYLITSAADWNTLSANVNNGEKYDGVYFKQTADISVTTMLGPSTTNNNYKPFSGIYDGYGNTLNVTYSGSGECAAPFLCIEGATIKNIHITGSITTTGLRPASIASFVGGNSTITNCWSEVAISTSNNSDIDAGGFVGRVNGGFSLTMTGCLFTGSITYSNANGFEGGGMVGYTQAGSSATLNNCVFAPSAISIKKYSGHNMFVGGKVLGTLTNCYYNDVAAASSLTKEGKQARSISAGTDVTISGLGDATATYNVSGITAYATGIKYNDVYYAGNGDEVSLALSHADAAEGYSFNEYTATAGTLSGTTLTMPDADVTINATWIENVTLTDGEAITGLDTYKGQEIWVNYTRSFTAGKPSTVCLPFAYTKKTGDGSFYEFTNIEKNGSGEYVATMTEPAATTLEANTPYLYLPNATGDVDFGGAYTIPSELTAGSYTSGDWTFKGTFATIEWTSAPAGTYGFSAQNANGINQGEFVKVGNYVRIKPMRCYLQYIGDDSQWSGVRGKNRVAAKLPETIKVRLIGADGTVTAIGSLSTTTGEMTMDGAWYSINGTRLNGTPATKGIYVRNGKKVVIK